MKIFLTSLIAIGVVCPVFAEGEDNGTISDAEGNLLEGKGCDYDTLKTYSGRVNIEAIWNLINEDCSVGQYFNKETVRCETCTADYFCPSAGEYNIDSPTDGRESCSSITNGLYPNSLSGATAETSCFRACDVEDVNHATAIIGNVYYGGATTCSAISCDTGWKLNFEGNDKEPLANVSVDPYIINGSSDNTWGVVDEELGSFLGVGSCNNESGTNPVVNNVSGFDMMPAGTFERSFSGAVGTSCWCQLISYMDSSASSWGERRSPWFYMYNVTNEQYGETGASFSCDYCGYICGQEFVNNVNFRNLMLGRRATCTEDTIMIDWYNDTEENNGTIIEVQEEAQQCTYGGGITVPDAQHTPTPKKGFRFGGWKVRGLLD